LIYLKEKTRIFQGIVRERKEKKKTQSNQGWEQNQSTRGKGRRIRTSVAGGTGRTRARRPFVLKDSSPEHFSASWFSYFYSSGRATPAEKKKKPPPPFLKHNKRVFASPTQFFLNLFFIIYYPIIIFSLPQALFLSRLT
jgi:hypothetical protein